MKRLITLIASAALLCPIWASAQTVPNSSDKTTTVVGSFTPIWFSFDIPLQITPVTIYSSGSLSTVSALYELSLTIFAPNNKSGNFGISGYANSSTAFYTPLTGTILYINPEGPYITTMVINIGASSFSCNLNPTTLNGTCYGTSAQGPTVISYRGVQ